jgi:hypothetical protein
VDFVYTGNGPVRCLLPHYFGVRDREGYKHRRAHRHTHGRSGNGQFRRLILRDGTMSTYTYDSGTGQTTMEVHSRVVYIEAKRSRFAQALTLCLFLVNWALSVSSIYIVLLVVYPGRRGQETRSCAPGYHSFDHSNYSQSLSRFTPTWYIHW